MKVENNVYIKYADFLFSGLGTTGVGTGSYLTRWLRAKYGKGVSSEDFKILNIVLFNLCVNDFLDTDDPDLNGFFKLTQKGADYLAGGPLAVNKVDFKMYIHLEKEPNVQFDDLWTLIGNQDTAIFYIKGPVFLNLVKQYIDEYIPDYMQYMEDRRSQEVSTSRRIWYRELYVKIPRSKITDFLDDLSYAVENLYYYKEDDGGELEEYINTQLAKSEDLIKSVLPEYPEIRIEPSNTKKTPSELFSIAKQICNKFKSLVEDNRMYKLLYNDDDSPKNETASQLLFYSMAKGFCDKYDIDINRESDPGIGELDFKFSVGNLSKVIIEMKLSTNSNLFHGYSRQLPAYLRAEDTEKGILVVIQYSNEKNSQQVQLEAQYEKDKLDPKHNVELIVVDATPKPSASKI